MRRIEIRIALTLAAAAAFAAGAGALAEGGEGGQNYVDGQEYAARDEFRQTYRIAPDATVRVRGIAGPVSVETGDGETAEVHVIRMAATERELQCYRTDVTASHDRLTIEHVQLSDRRGCRSIRSRQQVRLRLPHRVSLDISTIAGALDVAPIDGRLEIDSIAGTTSLARVRSAEISSIAGRLSVGIAPVGPEGVSIDSVAGPVELTFEQGTDADLRVDSVMGSVRSYSPGIDLIEEDGTYRARIGSGRGRVSLSSVVGSVRVTQ